MRTRHRSFVPLLALWLVGMPALAQEQPRGEGGDDDADIAARALERTLVQRGALLVPEWRVELTPVLSYSHVAADAYSPAEGPVLLGNRVRINRVTAAADVRLGLPWQSQLELRVPFVYGERRAIVDGPREVSASGADLGDVEIGISHQFLNETLTRPNLLATMTWRTTSGGDPFEAGGDTFASGSGFDALTGSVTLTKSREPLVFLGSFGVTRNFPADKPIGRVDPGTSWGFSVGAVLAVSPETSMNVIVDWRTSDSLTISGQDQIGTEGTSAILQFGAATLITPATLLNFSVGAGLTPDSPDVTLALSLPVRF